MKLSSFWTLSIILFLFKIQHLADWILSLKHVLNKNSMPDNVQKLNNCTCSIPNKVKTDIFSRLQSLGMLQITAKKTVLFLILTGMRPSIPNCSFSHLHIPYVFYVLVSYPVRVIITKILQYVWQQTAGY
jgi:hypothetical protein